MVGRHRKLPPLASKLSHGVASFSTWDPQGMTAVTSVDLSPICLGSAVARSVSEKPANFQRLSGSLRSSPAVSWAFHSHIRKRRLRKMTAVRSSVLGLVGFLASSWTRSALAAENAIVNCPSFRKIWNASGSSNTIGSDSGSSRSVGLAWTVCGATHSLLKL